MRIILLLITVTVSAQGWDGTHVYFPQYTKHFNSNPLYASEQLGSEGGSKGFLLTRSGNGAHFTLGFMQNSYGEFSHYLTAGFNLNETKRSQLSLHFGFADNYSKVYWDRETSDLLYKYLPRQMADNSIVPIMTLVYKFKITKRIGVHTNISPIFVNTGIFVQI